MDAELAGLLLARRPRRQATRRTAGDAAEDAAAAAGGGIVMMCLDAAHRAAPCTRCARLRCEPERVAQTDRDMRRAARQAAQLGSSALTAATTLRRSVVCPTPLPRGCHPERSGCAPAPCRRDEDAYILQGCGGRRNGEKRLRAQLTRTPQWESAASREEAASAAEAWPDLQLLVRVMRRRDNCRCVTEEARRRAARCADRRLFLPCRHASTLCKRHLMFVARVWGYSSNIW